MSSLLRYICRVSGKSCKGVRDSTKLVILIEDLEVFTVE